MLGIQGLGGNVRLYVVGRGISASYESFRPNAVGGGERNLQYAVEPRLPYTALFCAVFIHLLHFRKISLCYAELYSTEYLSIFVTHQHVLRKENYLFCQSQFPLYLSNNQ